MPSTRNEFLTKLSIVWIRLSEIREETRMGAGNNDDLKEQMARALKQALSYSQDTAVNIARIDERVATLKSSMEGLSKLLFVGNGKPSLVAQMVELGQSILMLQGEIASLTSGLSSLNSSVSQFKRDEQEMGKLHQSNRSARNIAVLSSVTSLIVALIAALALYITKH